MLERRCKEREKGWVEKKPHPRSCYWDAFEAASPAKTKYEQFHRAVGRLPRGRDVITIL
jgi:hypothetical protein